MTNIFEQMTKRKAERAKAEQSESSAPNAEPIAAEPPADTKPEPQQGGLLAGLAKKEEKSSRPNPLLNLHANQQKSLTKIAKAQEAVDSMKSVQEAESEAANEVQAPSTALGFANVDTAGMKAVTKRVNAAEALLMKERAKVQKGPEDFRLICDQLDELIGEDEDFDPIVLGPCRGFVKIIAESLKANPELDSIFVDKDARNVIRTLRRLRLEAESAAGAAVVKKATKTTKKKAASLDKFGKLDLDQMMANFALKKGK